MINLYGLFIQQVVRYSLKFFCLGVAALFFFDRFCGIQLSATPELLLVLFAVAASTYFVGPGNLVARNLNWLMVLPVSKRRVAWLNAFTRVCCVIAGTVAVMAIIASVDVLEGHRLASFRQIWRHVVLPIRHDWRTGALENVYYWSGGVLMLAFLYSVCASIPLRSSRTWKSFSRREKIGALITCAGALALFPLMAKDAMPAFGIVTVLTLALYLLGTYNAAWAARMPRALTRRAIYLTSVFALCQVAFLYSTAARESRQGSSHQRAQALLFLGPLTPGMSQESWAQLLEGELRVREIEQLGRRYQHKFCAGMKIRGTSDKTISFARMIVGKRSGAEILAGASLFDPAELNATDLTVLFEALAKHLDTSRLSELAQFIPAKVSSAESMKWLASKNPVAVAFSLMRSRTVREAELIPAISKRMVMLDEGLRWMALSTLSLLTGQHLSLDEWASLKSGRAPATTLYTADCTPFLEGRFESLIAKDMPAMNICLWGSVNPADAARVEELQNAGWIGLPLSDYNKSLIRRVFTSRYARAHARRS